MTEIFQRSKKYSRLEPLSFLSFLVLGGSLNVANTTTLFISVFLAVLSYFTKSLIIALAHFLIAIVIFATFHLGLYGLIGDTGISPNLVIIMISCIAMLLTGFTSLFRTYHHSQGPSLWQEALILGSSSLLVLRWPVDTVGKSMAVLKPEDNARWIGFAADLSPLRQGAVHPSAAVGGGAGGGHVFDYFISIIHSITNLSISTQSSSLSTSYISITNAYRLTIVLLLFFASIIVFLIVRKTGNQTFAITSAMLVPMFMYPALYDVVLRTGHLSLLVAMLFFMATMVFCFIIEVDIHSSKSQLLLTAIIGFGIGGIWWPALPVSLGVAIICGIGIVLNLSRHRKPILIIFLAIGIYLAWRFMSIYFIQYFEVVSVRSFFAARGGIQEVSNLILGLSLIAICYVYPRTLESHGVKTRISIWILPIITLAVYAFSLLIISYFTGPDFSPNYSVKKVMFFLYLMGIPFLFAGLSVAVSLHKTWKTTFLSPLLAVSLAINSFGLDVNVPRQIPDLAWGQGLQQIVQKDPKAVILCSTNTNNSYESYVCTRHAKSLLATGNWLTKAWQDYILTPQVGSIEKTMSEIYSEFRRESPSSRIYLLSLEPQFLISEQNKWWMDPLPWDEIIVVDGQSGNLIPKLSAND